MIRENSVKTDKYYDRNPKFGETNTTQADKSNESRVERILSQKWEVIFHKYAHYDNIDWWLEKDDKMVGVAELKTAFRESSYAYLNLRKYLNLKWSSYLLKMPALIIFQFKDGGIYYDNIENIEGRPMILGSKIMKSTNDIEPGISIPISSLRKVEYDEKRN